MLKINSKAPSFVIPSTSKDKYSLKESLGKYVVLYFYPKDDTPGCTIETNDFNKLLAKFKKLECEVYGISKDSLKSHDKFRDKYKITVLRLDDFKRKILEKKINNDTIVFNNLINLKSDLTDNWEIPLNRSWHQKFIK